ncbi:lipocalin [Xanthomonas arboricola]|nr:lipocalin [Xanthomonas cannabis]
MARSKRDYVWYMARTPQVSEADYQQAVQRIAAMGYDVSQLRRVPQSAR